MKIFLIIIGICIFSQQGFPELSKNDIEEIRKIVREEISREVGALKNETNAKIDGSNAKIDGLRSEMNARFEGIDNRFEEIDKRFQWLYILLSSIIGLIGVMVGSVLWLAKQERPMSMKHYNEITKREKWLEREILGIKDDIEALKLSPAI